MRLGMIWAEARGGAIGRGGEMPWHLPEDLAHFKQTTLGAPVIMGRLTWQSLPERFRPLPQRENLVITRDSGYSAPGATVSTSLEDAISQLKSLGVDFAWIMGGGKLYRAAMPVADELVVTRIEHDVPDADTFAPEIDSQWRLASSSESMRSRTGLDYRFERWVRDS